MQHFHEAVRAHPLWPFSRQGSDPLKLSYNKPVTPAVLVTGPTATYMSPFILLRRRNHRQSSLHRPTEDGQAKWAGVARLNTRMADLPKVTNPKTNWARCSCYHCDKPATQMTHEHILLYSDIETDIIVFPQPHNTTPNVQLYGDN